MPVDDFIALERAEDILSGGALSGDTLCEQIGRVLRAPSVEYNGHFGSYIYFEVDADEDSPEMRARVLQLIEAQVAAAKAQASGA